MKICHSGAHTAWIQRYFSSSVTWNGANDICTAIGQRLTVLYTEEKLNYVKSQMYDLIFLNNSFSFILYILAENVIPETKGLRFLLILSLDKTNHGNSSCFWLFIVCWHVSAFCGCLVVLCCSEVNFGLQTKCLKNMGRNKVNYWTV